MKLFRYPGGKSRKEVQEKILKYVPPRSHFSQYRDATVGGGGIFWALNHHNCWINDINPDLMSVYAHLKFNPQDFLNACAAIPSTQDGEPLDKRGYSIRLGKVFKDLFHERMHMGFEGCHNPALNYFFLNRTVWAGRVNYEPGFEKRMYYSNPSGWNIIDGNALTLAALRMTGTPQLRITTGRYEPMLTELHHGSEMALVYIDPPYFRDTTLPRGDKQYAFGFTQQDHVDLRDRVRESGHFVMLSYDDHPFIRSLYKGFCINEETWTYCGSALDRKPKGKELVITNYDLTNYRLVV